MKNYRRVALLISLFFIGISTLFGQVTNAPVVQVNSGNPRFPFPRFAEYGAGKNLALYNPDGVVHAEMEQDIRDAYQIMMNRARVETISLGGTPYISFNNFVQHADLRGGYGTFVTEGDGYALIAAAYMADKKTFDGLWMWCHDFRLTHVKRYIDCTDLRPNYYFGKYAELWNVTSTGASSEDRATDGTVDYGIALLMAYRQWGEHSGITDACGNEINYKTEALNFINSMVEPFLNTDRSDNLKYYMMGVVGLDGYTKSGNKWIELTDWATGTLQSTMTGIGVPMTGTGVDPSGLSANVYWINGRTTTRDFFDYHASGYFKEYGDFLQEVYDANDPKYVTTLFNIAQCRRAEASTDWLMQQAIAKGYTPYIGGISACANDGSSVTFQNVGEGEDFRLPMRTITNYIWHGTPSYKWDPVNHKVIAGTQPSELAAANKLCTFLKAPGNNCETLGSDPTGAKLKYTGVTVLRQAYDMTGTPIDAYYTNYTLGSSVTAPVAAGDVDLAAKMYRQLTIEWDVEESLAEVKADPLKRYLKSTPKYFHGYYRNFGMLMLTGNYIAPTGAAPVANLKCYVDINKTYGPVGDIVTYTASYRNYASVAAQNSVLTFTVPNEVAFVSCQGGGVYNAATRKITWNLATVPGFVTGGLAATKGQFAIVTKVTASTGRFCPTSSISCTNGTGWTSNEFPNNISATMQRNCYDIVGKALEITKTSNVAQVNPAMPVEYSIKFKNNASAGYLDGGRPGTRATFAVGFSGGNTDAGAANSMSLQLFFRLYHAADEAYIDYSNYRLSFYMKSDTRGITPALGSDGWFIKSWIDEGGPLVTKWDEIILPFGNPVQSSVNQRIIIGFPSALAAPAAHLYNQTGNDHRIHKGINFPLKLSASLTDGKSVSQNFSDDWSYNSAIRIDQTDDKNLFYPVTPDFTDPINFPAGQTVNTWHTEECRTASLVYNKVLIEEFDGYGWRRIFGTSPLPGRPATDVVMLDTIPKEFIFDKFIDTASFGRTQLITSGSLQIVKWSNSSLLPGQELTIKYKVNAKTETALGGCPLTINTKNISWLYSVGEAAQSDTADVKITCETIVNPPTATTMTKTADKASYAVGENINYTINFEQTVGTTSTPDLNSSTGWTTRFARPLPTFSSGKITFNNQNYGFITNNYAHGKDGSLDVSFTRTNVSESFSFFFRYDPTSTNVPGTAGFKGIAVSVVPSSDWSGLGLLAYDGATKLTPIYGAEDKLPVSVTTMTMSFVVRNDSLIIWLNKSTNLTPSVIYRVTTLTPGYAGIFGGKVMGSSYVTGTINSWSSHFDSAFNLQITDPMPAEVTFVSADNSGVNTSGTVSWPFQAGPVLKGTKYKYGWVATLATCPTTKTIRNTAYVNVLGQPTNSIGAFVTVTCGTTVPLCTAPTSVTLTSSPTGSVCTGNTVTLTGSATPAGTWTYAFKKATTVVQNSTTLTTYNANTTGNYSFLAYDIKDSANCVKVATVATVTINPLPTIVATATPSIICTGATATVSASGGSSYVWNPVLGAGGTVNPTAVTSYTVTGTDANGCVNTATVSLGINALPTITATATPSVICAGATATLSAGGGTSYSWSNTLGTGSPKTVSPSTTATYSLTGTDANGCVNSAIVKVTVSPSLSVGITASNAAICKGTTTTLTAAGATSYIWSNTLPAGTSNVVSPGANTTYSVTGTTGACSGIGSLAITVNNLPSISIAASPTLVCSGSSTTLTASGGSTYAWSGTLGTGTSVTATPTVATSYTVTGSDANGCSGTASVNVAFSAPALPTVGTSPTISIGAAIPTLTASGTGTLKWYDASKATVLYTGTSYIALPANLNTSANGTTDFYVTNTVNGCESGFVKISVTVNGCNVVAPTVDKLTISTCQGKAFGSITASGTGTSFTWYAANQTTVVGSAASYTPTTTVTADYYVSQTNVCEGPKTKVTATVNALPAVSASASKTILCEGAASTLTATGGTSFIWSNSLGSNATVTVTPTASTTYKVTVSDANSCSNTASVAVTVNPMPTVSISPATASICPGKSQTLTASGATGFTWADGSITAAITVSPTATQTYSVTGTSAGCSSPAVATVTVYPVNQTIISPANQSICTGAVATITASASSSYVWSNSVATAAITVSPTATASYSVTGTDINNCITTVSTIVTVNSLPAVIATAANPSICLGNATNITASGALTYNWSNTLGSSATVSVTPTANTTYTVTGTNTYGCSNTANVTVSTLALPTATLTGGGSYCTTIPTVTVNVSGGKANYKVTYTTNLANPYTMTGVTGSSALPISADGDYAITQVEDANGCQAASYPAKVTVKKNGSATYTIAGGAIYCQGQTRNPITINITSADEPWTLEYSDGTNPYTTATLYASTMPYTINNPAKGIYTVKQITNKDGCIAQGDATKKETVTINDTTIATFTGVPASLCDNGKAITLAYSPTLASGETAVISSVTGGISGNQFNPSQAGGAGNKTITITYTNAANCKSVNSTIVKVLQSPVASITGAPSMSVCYGIDQVITGTHTSTTASNTFGWYYSGTLLTANNVESPTFMAGTPKGIYPMQFVVSDGNGCQDTASISVEVKDKTKPKWKTNLPELCTNGNSIDLKDYVTPYDAINGSFTINAAPTGTTIFDPKIKMAAKYTIVYTYATGSCSDNNDTILTVNAAPTISLGTYQSEFCSDGSTYDFSTVLPTGGTLTGMGSEVSGLTFDPTKASTKDVAYNLNYSLTQTGCTDTKSIQVTVWSKPSVSFALPTVACAKDAGMNLNSLVNITTGGVYTCAYSIAEGVSGTYFYPKTVTTFGSPIAISYTVTAHGCSNTVNKAITVHKTVVPTVTDASAIVPVTTVPPITATGTAGAILKLYSETYGLMDGNWNGSYADQNNKTAKEYPYFVTQTLNGCESDSVPVKLTITSCTALTPTGISNSQCLGDVPKTLNATGLTQAGMEYRWFLGTTFTDTIGSQITMKPGLAVGKYNYYVKIYDPANTCYGAASQPVVYEVKDLPKIQFSPDTVMCENSPVQNLTAKVAQTASTFWLGGSQIPNFDPTGKSGIYQVEVRYTDANGCKNTLKDTIRVQALPTAILTPAAPAICFGKSQIITASGATSYAWSNGLPVAASVTVQPTTTQTYNVTATALGCSNTASVVVTVHPLQQTVVNVVSPAICYGSGTTLTAQGSGSYLWSTSASSAAITVSPTATTNYIVTGTDANACKTTASTIVTVNQLPSVTSTIPVANLKACSNGGPVALNGLPTAMVFSGTGVTKTLTGYIFSPKTTGGGNFPIVYSYTDNNTGCSNSASVTIDVQNIQPPVVADQTFYSFKYPKILQAGTKVNWYGKKGDKSDLILANTTQLTNVDLKNKGYADSLNIASSIPYQFYVTQTTADLACESDTDGVKVTIKDCSAKQPNVSTTTPRSCYGEAFATISITHNNGNVATWYNANNVYIGTGDNFTPTALHLANPKGSSFLYVADSLTTEGCKSTLLKITYTVNYVNAPQVSGPNPNPQCEDAITGAVTATDPNGNAGIFNWTLDGTKTFTGSSVTLDTAGITKGRTTPYSFSVTQQDANGCKSIPAVQNVTITSLPAEPTVPAYWERCLGDVLPSLVATATGTVTWYRLPNKTNFVSNNPLQSSLLDTAVGLHQYYATNDSARCSSSATALYKINEPGVKPTVQNVWKCATSSLIPQLTANVQLGDVAVWYADKALTPPSLATGSTYQPLQADVMYYVVADRNGCKGSSDSVKVETFSITPPSVASIKVDSSNFCKPGDNVVLTSKVGQVTWYDNNKLLLENTTSHIAHFDSIGTYNFYATRLENKYGTLCYSDYSSPITITQHAKTQKLSFTVPYIEVCAQAPIQALQISNPPATGTVIWQDSIGVNLGSGLSYLPRKKDVSIGTTKTFTATLMEYGKCYGAPAYISYQIHDTVAKPRITQSPTPYCIGSSAVPLKITTDVASPMWLNAGNESTVPDSIIAKAQTPGKYIIKVYQKQGTCMSDTVSKTIVSYKTPEPKIEGQDSLCEKSYAIPYALNTESQDLTSKYNWSITGEVVNYSLDKTKQFRRVVDWVAPGIDTIRVTQTSLDGCVGRDSVIVKVAPTPVALFNVENAGQEGVMLFFNHSEQAPITDGSHVEPIPNTYIWNFGRPADKPIVLPDSLGTVENPIKQTFDYGYWNVSLNVSNQFGCAASYAKDVFVNISTGLYMPNSFMPESASPHLKYFRPVGFNLKSYKISIYDTWGNLIWYSDKLKDDSPADAWDGTYNGEVLKCDTYIWKVDAEFKNEKVWKGNEKRSGKYSNFGSVLLLR